MKSRLFRWQYFIWMPLLAALTLLWFAYGTPYFIWSYSWVGGGYGNVADRHYTSCTYLKLTDLSQSHQDHYPTNGRCAWVFFPERKL